MKRSEAEKIYKLLEEHTRAEICARLLPSKDPTLWGDFFQIKLERMDEIRRLLFGTDCLVTLGDRWGILKSKKKKKKKKSKGKSKKKKQAPERDEYLDGIMAKLDKPKKKKKKSQMMGFYDVTMRG